MRVKFCSLRLLPEMLISAPSPSEKFCEIIPPYGVKLLEGIKIAGLVFSVIPTNVSLPSAFRLIFPGSESAKLETKISEPSVP